MPTAKPTTETELGNADGQPTETATTLPEPTAEGWIGRFGKSAWPNGDGPVVVDLCAGCGGLSLGFHAAGFRVVSAVEIDAAAVEAHHQNFPDVHILGPGKTGDIREVTGQDILNKAGVGASEIDLIIAGLPCQGFSIAGSRDPSDPRNLLYKEFIRLVRQIRPRAFLFENVPNMKSFDGGTIFNALQTQLTDARYHHDFSIVNAATYRIPQLRSRLFVTGTRTKRNSIKLTDGQLGKTQYTPVEDAFDGLFADLTTVPAEGPYDLPYEETINSSYGRLMRAPTSQTTVANCIPVQHSAELTERFRLLGPGKMDPISRHRRLDWKAPAWTLRAGTRTDTACRPVHPDVARVITVREAARLASFPDEFWFPDKKSTAHMMIGNSVPPLLAYHLALQIARQVFGRPV